MDITTLSKKELKEYIGKNGFYANMMVNALSKDDNFAEGFSTNSIKTKRKLPEGENIIVFKGLASQAYKKGEKNRNGYKIDPNGWDFTDYMHNPLILLQHNSDYGGIGHALEFEITNKGLNILFYVDTNNLDAKTANQVKNGYISALSTGHITEEEMVEDNKTGKRMTISEAADEGVDLWRLMWGENDDYTLVVTKALAVENSLVTIGSNALAMAMPNALGNHLQEKYKILLEKTNNINGKNMGTKITKNDVDNTTPEVVETPAIEAPVAPEAKNEDAPVDAPEVTEAPKAEEEKIEAVETPAIGSVDGDEKDSTKSEIGTLDEILPQTNSLIGLVNRIKGIEKDLLEKGEIMANAIDQLKNIVESSATRDAEYKKIINQLTGTVLSSVPAMATPEVKKDSVKDPISLAFNNRKTGI